MLKINSSELSYDCVNDEVFCKCRGCSQNRSHGGTCVHCLTCIDGECSMDVCDEYNSFYKQ